MTPFAFLLLLLALSKRNAGASSSPAPASAPSPVANPQGPFAFPAIPVSTPVVVPGGAGRPTGPVFSPGWQAYAPLNPTIVARAQQLLATPSSPTEVIEPDPTRPGSRVRFLKLRANGKLNVIAQMPRAGAAAPATVTT